MSFVLVYQLLVSSSMKCTSGWYGGREGYHDGGEGGLVTMMEGQKAEVHMI